MSVRLGCHDVGDVDDHCPNAVFVSVFYLISFIRLSVYFFRIRMEANLTSFLVLLSKLNCASCYNDCKSYQARNLVDFRNYDN